MCAEMKKGKDPECLMYDCPHKKELDLAVDELNQEKLRNEALNQRLESVDALIEQGIIDVRGLFEELLKGNDKITDKQLEQAISNVERVFDTQKITDIVNDNLKMRKEAHRQGLKLMELQAGLKIALQEKEGLLDTIRLREDRDKEIIKDMRNMDRQAEEQHKLVEGNKVKINRQEQELKVIEEFIGKARETIKGLKQEHEFYQKEIKALKTPNLTPEGKRVVKLIKKVESLKNKPNGAFFKVLGGNASKAEYKTKMVYMELKDRYFGLAEFEKQKIVERYDKVAQMMGE